VAEAVLVAVANAEYFALMGCSPYFVVDLERLLVLTWAAEAVQDKNFTGGRRMTDDSQRIEYDTRTQQIRYEKKDDNVYVLIVEAKAEQPLIAVP
jgi:hypothetical protein